jgi:hypothetical protein
MSGPCLTDAAPETAPVGGREAAMRRPERQPQRSLRQSASVVSSPPLYRMCHDVTVTGILAAEVSVSLTTKRVNRIVTPHAVTFSHALAAWRLRNLPSSGLRSLPLSRIVQGNVSIAGLIRDRRAGGIFDRDNHGQSTDPGNTNGGGQWVVNQP